MAFHTVKATWWTRYAQSCKLFIVFEKRISSLAKKGRNGKQGIDFMIIRKSVEVSGPETSVRIISTSIMPSTKLVFRGKSNSMTGILTLIRPSHSPWSVPPPRARVPHRHRLSTTLALQGYSKEQPPNNNDCETTTTTTTSWFSRELWFGNMVLFSGLASSSYLNLFYLSQIEA